VPQAVIGGLDLSLAPSLLWALVVGCALPIYLAIVARLPPLAGRNALQFLCGLLVMMGLWVGLVALWPGARPLGVAELCAGLMILGAGSLFYLEIWGLLSRGYTLGLLLTLYRADRPLTEDELAQGYRGGGGLSWIMRHRLAGLVGAGFVREQGRVLSLTPAFGVAVAWLYKVSILALGLRRTG
jgi:hypothetical protein